MTSPAFRSYARQFTITGGATTLTATEPTGAAQDDILIMYIMIENATAHTLTGPSGWTLITPTTGNNPEDAGANSFKFYVYAIRRGSGAPSYGISWTTGLTVSWCEADVIAYSGADTSAAVSSIVKLVVGTPSATATIDPPAITTPNADNLVGAGAFTWNSWTGTPTAPTGYTIVTGSGGGFGTAYAHKAIAAAGLENPGAFSPADASDQTVGFSWSIASTDPSGGVFAAGPALAFAHNF